jgi:hypothetical protein
MSIETRDELEAPRRIGRIARTTGVPGARRLFARSR